MNAGNFNVCAAIWFTVPASDAPAAVKIRYEGYDITFAKPWQARVFRQFTGEFMPQDAGVIKIGLGSFEGVKVRAANTNPPDLYQCVVVFMFRE
jgi:hypothetical protein